MSDVKFILPGSETITMAGQTADMLINTGDGTAALLYIFILRTHGQRSLADTAQALGKPSSEIAAAMSVLAGLGLIQYDKNKKEAQQQYTSQQNPPQQNPPQQNPPQQNLPQQNPPQQNPPRIHSQTAQNAVNNQYPKSNSPAVAAQAPVSGAKSSAVTQPPAADTKSPVGSQTLAVSRPANEEQSTQSTAKTPVAMDKPNYTINDIKREMSDGSPFNALIDEVQSVLGKIMSPVELAVIFGIYDTLKMPPEVILQLINYCVEENQANNSGRSMPTIKFIEKAAYRWEREGIITLEKAEAHIKEENHRRTVQGEIKRTLHIKDRELSPTERVFIEGWVKMGFGADAVDLAYDKTVLNTGKLAWSYMDSILKSWHSKDMHTAEEIVERDTKRAKTAKSLLDTTKSRAAPNATELEQMKKLLRMIKEDS